MQRKNYTIVSLASCDVMRARECISRGANAIELRIDLLPHLEMRQIAHFFAELKKTGITSIATLRTQSEGGQWSGNYLEYSQIMKQLMTFDCDFIDVEIAQTSNAEWVQLKLSGENAIIASYHNFDSTPSFSALSRMIENNISPRHQIIKIATQVKNRADLQCLTKILCEYSTAQNIAVLAMGEVGKVLRFYAPYLGSCLSFVHTGEPFSPGQLSLVEWQQLKSQFLQL